MLNLGLNKHTHLVNRKQLFILHTINQLKTRLKDY